MHQSKEAEKKGTTLFHMGRAVHSMLKQADLAGLATWFEENPPCRILGPSECRYEATDLPPFENHNAEVWKNGVWRIQ